MKSKYILSLDQGTTSSRAVLFDLQGRPYRSAAREYRQHYPQPGWVEHDPFDIWSSQSSVITELLSQANVSARSIAGIGITNQRETVVVWNRHSGVPVYNAIVWQDRRTADYCGQLQQQGVAESLAERTGLRPDPYFSASKIKWILDNVKGVRSDAAKGHILCGTIDSWLIWKLTAGKVHATDITNASRTLLFNIHTQSWDDELLKLFDIPAQILPEVRSCSEIYGHVSKAHYPAGVPIAGVAGDQQAALFGQACFERGMAKNTYGTGCFLLLNTGSQPVRSHNNLLSTVAWKIGDEIQYALEGSVFIGGAVIQWLRDELQLIRTAQECDQLAASVADAGGLYLVPAFAGLGAPYWDPYARGIAVGITRGTNKAHFCRAAIESIAHQCADLLEAMSKDATLPIKELRVDGGAARSSPLLQFQADLLGVDVVRPQCIETTALGAAGLAGLAVGFWKTRQDFSANWQQEARFTPDPSAEAAPLRDQWRRAVKRSTHWETQPHTDDES